MFAYYNICRNVIFIKRRHYVFPEKKYLFIVLLLCIFTMKCTLAFAKKTAKDNYRILVIHS